MKIRYHSGAVCLGALLLFGGGAARAAGPTCESLAGLSLADITITTAHSVPAGSFTAADGEVFAGMPAFCRIAAFAAPTTQSHINFEVWMPQSGWNGKFRGEGSGGSAGSISFSAMASALQRGYATMANDNGHTGSVWTFSAMPEKVTDFGWRAQHVTTVAGKAITQAFYGRHPEHSYFVGCSQGGHHALMEAQRFPEDYDGIIAGDPANDWTHLMFGELWAGVQTSVKGASFDLPQAKLNLVTSAVLAACLGQDGGLKSDTWLNDPRDCHFDPRVLACTGADAPNCLTPGQLSGIQALYKGPVNPRTHRQIFPGFARGTETFYRQVLVGLTIPGGSSASFFRDGVFAGQPGFNFLNINFDSDVAYTDNKPISSGETWATALDANDVTLAGFRRRGNKLIMYHGFADPFITPYNSLDYYSAVANSNGDEEGDDDGGLARTRRFARLFMVPGMNHCAGGPGANSFGGVGQGGASSIPQDAQHDVVRALEQWVEHGVAPERIVATKFVNDQPASGVAFTRPLCAYPEIAVYKGTGSTTDAASFACVRDERDSNGPQLDDYRTPRSHRDD